MGLPAKSERPPVMMITKIKVILSLLLTLGLSLPAHAHRETPDERIRGIEAELKRRGVSLPGTPDSHRNCESPECAPSGVRPNAPPALTDDEYRREVT